MNTNAVGKILNTNIFKKAVTQLGKPGALLPVALLEVTVDVGRGLNAYKRGGATEARERITDDVSAGIFWLFGAVWLNKLGNLIGKKFLGIKNPEFSLGADKARNGMAQALIANAGNSNKKLALFKLGKVISSIAIKYTPNDSLDRSQAGAYCEYFLTKTTGLWDDNGIENGVADIWAQLNGVYDLLSETTKASLKAKALAEKGVSDDTTVGNAMARYYWAVKNHAANTDFVGGENEDIRNSARADISLFNDGLSNNSAATIVLIISLLGLTAMGGYLFLRKRKEQ